MKGWKAAVLVIGVLLGLAAPSLLWIDVVAARRWEETLRRTAEIEAELNAPLERSPLRGEPLPGNAWDDYQKALLIALGVKEESPDAIKAFDEAHADPTRHTLPHEANPMRQAIDGLRLGTRRSTSRHASTPPVFPELQDCLHAEAHCKAASGNVTEAIELLVDLVRVGHEKATPDFSDYNLRIAKGALTAACTLLARARPSEISPTLSKQFEILEESVPSPARKALYERIHLARMAEADGFFEARVSGSPSWRNAWSLRLGVSRTADTVERFARAIVSVRECSWVDVERRESEIFEEFERTENQLLLKYTSYRLVSETWEHIAHLRVARAGAHFKATGERLQLEDPFGGKLAWDEEGVRSRGTTDDPKDDIILRLKP